jgi:hypothetical protein
MRAGEPGARRHWGIFRLAISAGVVVEYATVKFILPQSFMPDEICRRRPEIVAPFRDFPISPLEERL